MPYQVVARSTIKYGQEKYSSTEPGTGSNIASYSSQPSLVLLPDNRTILCSYMRGTSHAAVGSITVINRSRDRGRTWDDVSHNFQVIFNENIAQRNCLQTLSVLHSGRIVGVGFLQDIGGDQTTTSWLTYSDDDGDSWSSPIPLPTLFPGAGNWTVADNVCELNNGRLLCSVWTRVIGETRARSFCIYSDDATLVSWQQFATGGLGVMGSDANPNGLEYKENIIQLLQDGRVMGLIRSNDTAQIIYRGYSSDGGATWTAPAFAFNGFNWPTWKQLSNGDIVATSRHAVFGASDGNDCPMAVISSDVGVTWSSEINLFDPLVGTGAGQGSDLIELENGRVGIVLAYSPPSAIFNRTRLEFVVLDPNPRSSGSYGRYNVDSLPHPSKTLSNVFAWYGAESFRRSYVADGSSLDSWLNQMGLPSRDLVTTGGGTSRLVLHDGSTMTDGLIGGKGIATNAVTGNQHAEFNTATSIPQPLMVCIVGDSTSSAADRFVFDDGRGGGGVGMNCSGTAFFYVYTPGGSIRHWNLSGWPPGPIVLTLVLDGANTSLRLNGTVQSVSVAGTVNATTMQTFRLNGPNAGFWQGVREVVIAQTNDLTAIAAWEALMRAKHQI